MAVLESRPFRAPARTAVRSEIEVVEPLDTTIDEISEVWEPGQRIVLRCRVELSSDFWDQTAIPVDEEVTLVGSATCLPARATWRSTAVFTAQDDVWTAETLLEIDGGVIAVELLADTWVVGTARTGSSEPRNAIHVGAKLWQREKPVKLELESQQAAFPTTAISFTQTGRRDVPWTAEANPDAEPSWSVSSAIRLYINAESELAPAILEGSAPDDIFALIQSDIHLVVFHRLAAWRDTVPPSHMATLAEEDVGSLAALGASLAQSIGLPLGEALRLADEEPLGLAARSREALHFGRIANPV